MKKAKSKNVHIKIMKKTHGKFLENGGECNERKNRNAGYKKAIVKGFSMEKAKIKDLLKK